MNRGPSKKRVAAVARIRELAAGLRRGERLPTVRRLCASCGLSTATMELALEQLERERVIVRRPGAGIYIGPALGEKTVGIVIGHNIFAPDCSPYWSLLLQAAFRVAGERGIRCFSYMDVRETAFEWLKHGQLERDVASGVLDGILIVNAPEPATLSWLRGGTLPLVEIDGEGGACMVCQDVGAIAADAATLLVERGCTRIALLIHTIESVRQMFIRTLKRKSVPVDHRLLWSYMKFAGEVSHVGLEDFAAAFIRSRWETLGLVDARPDGIVIMDDTMARGAARALETLGVRVGRDIQIAALGTCHSPVLAEYEDRMHLLLLEPEIAVRSAYEMLERLMAGGKPKKRCMTVRPRVQAASSLTCL